MRNASEVTAGSSPQLNAGSRPPMKVLETKELFGADREIVIRHSGQDYRLRITRQNKLILTK